MLSVAARSPSCLVAVLPSDFWVARESVLLEAIERVFGLLQIIPESVATLGMIDTHPEDDADYLVVGPNNPRKGALIQARVNRPEPRIAKQLVDGGAMVASGILLGYAEAFAARFYKYWPQLAGELTNTLGLDCSADTEHRLSTNAYRHVPLSVMSSIRLSPPTFPMRAFRVQGSGWRSRTLLSDVPSEPATTRRTDTHGGNAENARYI
jgi:mannose-1-phosphate guanylyltransferase